MTNRSYIPKNTNSEETFQSALYKNYSSDILEAYQIGKTYSFVIHIDDCTVISKIPESKSKDTTEKVTIAGRTLYQIKDTKSRLENKLGYELIEIKK